MTLFDLAFILLFLAAVVTLLVAAGQALRGRVAEAGRVLRRLGIAAVGYLLVVALAGLVTPRRVLAVGDEQCSDDWCIAVAGVSSAGVGDARRYEVTFRVSSRARRVVQRERNVVVYLRDASGRRYEAQPEPATEPRFDVQLSPGEAVSTVRSFIVPAGARDVGLVVARGGVPFPTCCIIGDEGSVLHKRTVVRLD